MKDLRFMFNVDGVGFDAGSKSFALQAQSGLVGFFKCLLQEIGLKTVVDNGISPYWDHFPFFRAGVPCGSLSNMDVRETLGRYCHSSADTLDKISEPDLRLTSAAVARALLAIVRAGEGDWKETRRSAEEIVKALEDDNWMESLEFAGHRL
jgi:Zn-dependent M28 family amino/carboxypeptidase